MNRKKKTILIISGVVLALVLLIVIAGLLRARANKARAKELHAEFDEWLASLPQIPDAENGALVILEGLNSFADMPDEYFEVLEEDLEQDAKTVKIMKKYLDENKEALRLVEEGLEYEKWLYHVDTYSPTCYNSAKRKEARMTTQKEIRARQFILEDEKGETRAVLGVTEGGPLLGLYDEKGEIRAELSVAGGGPLLSLWDEKGETRAMLGVTGGGAVLNLLDEKGETRVTLSATGGGPLLSLYDENGEIRAALSVRKDGQRLSLCDENGEPIWTAP